MNDTMIGVAGLALAAAVILIWLLYRQRRMRTRRLVKGVLGEYFDSDMPPDQLGKRSRDVASRHFLLSLEFYSLAIAAYQSAFDAKFTPSEDANHARLEDESRLMRRLAALKKEFGLTDRYRFEGRPGRE
ncbi:MAG TPA: hypothetical protein VJY34_14555 [Roseiarcus sp.]|nr:hypothetical protein [Roseiarcus sp.]